MPQISNAPSPVSTAPAARATPAWALLASAVALALAGCAMTVTSGTTPDGVPVPAAWVHQPGTLPAGQAPTELAQWWQHFNDPQLTALVTQALQANTDVRAAQASLRQARALRDAKAAGLLPSLGASASAQRSQTGSNPAGNTFAAGFDASWEPDIFGGNRAALDAGEADARTAEASLAQVRVSMAAEVAVNYIEQRGLQARLAIARSNLANQSETLQITRWRSQAGLVSSLDVEQAVAATEQTRAQIPSLQTSLEQSRAGLAVLTGQAPGSLQGAWTATAPVPQAGADLALAIPARTLRQRPDIQAAEYRISAALARVAQADAARYPSFNIGGSLGLRALTVSALGNGASVVSSLLAGISVPLFDGGAARAQVQAQQAALESARISYEAAVLTALKDVENALVSLQGNRERMARLGDASQAAANAELLARQRYTSGLIDFRTVLDAQRTLLSTQDALEITRASVSADLVRLYKALGGGWTPDEASIATR